MAFLVRNTRAGHTCLACFIFLLFALPGHAEQIVLDQQRFLQQAFEDLPGSAQGAEVRQESSPRNSQPEMQTLWLNKELKKTILDKLDYRVSSLRIRYWARDKRTAWVLEEIGKERPITMGVVVQDGHIKDVKILVYRESRGGEVRYDFFTKQFRDAILLENTKALKLDKSIDGITGATLSVRAVKKVATLALFLHRQTPYYSNESEKTP